MSDSEKLALLIRESLCFGYDDITDTEYVKCEETAKKMIANGVTVQQWIPASEPPQRGGEYLCRCIVNDMDDMPFYMVLRYYIIDKHPHFQHETKGGMKVTHWRSFDRLELPQPPKGE